MTTEQPSPSPWHAGEVALQQRAGVAQRMEQFGRKVIRDFLPEQHRAFYPLLPFILLGTVDAAGNPWASVLEGHPGFAHSPDPQHLQLDVRPEPGDPAAANLANGAAVGLLGIELHSRRRNRLNGRVEAHQDAGFSLAVEQTFGNCPKYIQQRDAYFVRDPGTLDPAAAQELHALDDAARRLIGDADSCFVASYVDIEGDPCRRCVDVSHRGGRSGFIRVIGNRLTIPDFAGNQHFNTLGNLLLNPRAGLLFIDFATGDLLQLSGRTELLFDGPEVAAFQGAERLWRVHVERLVRRRGALALRWNFQQFSPHSLLTGTWP